MVTFTEEIIEEEIIEEEIIEDEGSASISNAAFFNLPAPPGNIDGEEDASFAWLEGSHYWETHQDLPDAPSLRLDEDCFFFKLVRESDKSPRHNKASNHDNQKLRFFQVVPKFNHLRTLQEAENALEHSLANQPVPTHIRKLEIELVQRQLPRYPSQTHRKNASFYPLVQESQTAESTVTSRSKTMMREAKFSAFYRSRLQARKKRIAEMEERKRLRKEQHAKRRAAREAKRRLAKERKQSKKRSRAQSSSVTISTKSEASDIFTSSLHKSKARAVPPRSTEQVTDVAAVIMPLNDDKSGEPKNTTVTESYVPSSHESSVFSSAGSMSSDYDTVNDFEFGDEDCLGKELDHFYIEEKQMMRQVHYRNIEDAEREQWERRLEAERLARTALEETPRHEEEEAFEDDEYGNDEYGDDDPIELDYLVAEAPASDEEHLSTTSLLSAPPPELPEEHYEPQIGVVPLSLQAMILQAQLEFRNRKVPEEHMKMFKPTCLEASEVGRFTRLNEYVVEAYGSKAVEVKALPPSATWKQGQEQVRLPKTADATASNSFMIFSEAVALGKLKALKPKVVTNYDLLGKSLHREELDIDDENRVKAMRTNFLTEEYVQGHRDTKKDELWDGADFEEEVRYENLDDVVLPAVTCPVLMREPTKMTSREMMDAIGQAVAERAWERRYRLERPHAEQKITRTCSCKFCEHANPFQTHAFRKKWLVQQGLWKEPSEELTETVDHESASDNEVSVDFGDESTSSESELVVPATDIDGGGMDPSDDQIIVLGEVSGKDAVTETNDFAEQQSLADFDGIPDQATEVSQEETLLEKRGQEDVFVKIESPKNEEALNEDNTTPYDISERPSSADDFRTDKKPSKKRSFLRGLVSMLGLVRPDDNDNSPSARAQRRRRERKQSHQRKRQSNSSIRADSYVGGKSTTKVWGTVKQEELVKMSKSIASTGSVNAKDPIVCQESLVSSDPTTNLNEVDTKSEVQSRTPQCKQYFPSDAQADTKNEICHVHNRKEPVPDPVLQAGTKIDGKGIDQALNFACKGHDENSGIDEGVTKERSHEPFDICNKNQHEDAVREPATVSNGNGGYLDEIMKIKISHDDACNDAQESQPQDASFTDVGGDYLSEIMVQKGPLGDEKRVNTTIDANVSHLGEILNREAHQHDNESVGIPSATSYAAGGYLDEILKRREQQGSVVDKPPTKKSNEIGGFLDDIAKLKTQENAEERTVDTPPISSSVSSGGGYHHELLKCEAEQNVELNPAKERRAACITAGGYLDELLKRKSKQDAHVEDTQEPSVNSTGGGGYLDKLLRHRAEKEAVEKETMDEPPAATTGGGGYLDDILKMRQRTNAV
jgi:hypothetical protein